MRRVKPIEIKYHYVGDDSPEAKAESERILEEVYDKIFRKMIQDEKIRRQKEAEGNNEKGRMENASDSESDDRQNT
jgi:hypothetical protein